MLIYESWVGLGDVCGLVDGDTNGEEKEKSIEVEEKGGFLMSKGPFPRRGRRGDVKRSGDCWSLENSIVLKSLLWQARARP